MIYLLTTIHVIVCIFLVIVVLLQSGKAADLAGAFGGMGSQTAFGPRGGATVLSRATTVAAAVFMCSSLTLAIMASRGAGTSSSVLDKQKTTQQKKPVTPAPPPPGAKPPMPSVSVETVTPTGSSKAVPGPVGTPKPAAPKK